MREDRTREQFEGLLRRELGSLLELSPAQFDALWQHYSILRRWLAKMNLISDRRLADIVRKHYCESLFLAGSLPEGALSVADLGSGAGFPGIPVAVFRPDCRVTLIESRARKAVFLREATRHLPNAFVAHCRAESLKAEFDWLIARAVAWAEIFPLVPRLSRRIALIVSRRTSDNLLQIKEILWQRAIEIPWRTASVLLTGMFHVEPG